MFRVGVKGMSWHDKDLSRTKGGVCEVGEGCSGYCHRENSDNWYSLSHLSLRLYTVSVVTDFTESIIV